MPAPIVLFTYCRPEHTRRTLESLQRNMLAADSDLIVYSDAARTPDKQPEVEAVRHYLGTVTGFRSVRIVARENNMGLANSIIDGVTATLRTHDAVIVLEDDMLTSPHFLTYMNDALACYADDGRVASIHGYSYPVEEQLPSTFFLRGADCWGWATWARAWRFFEADGARLLQELRQRRLTRAFDLDGSFPYTRMLEAQVAGTNNSWAIRWHASCFLQGLLTLYPGRTLVENIGNDSSGTHCATTDVFSGATAVEPVAVGGIPVAPSAAGRSAFVHFFRKQQPWPVRMLAALRGMLERQA